MLDRLAGEKDGGKNWRRESGTEGREGRNEKEGKERRGERGKVM